MPKSLKKAWKDANSAGEAYKKLQERQVKDGFFTEAQKKQKKKVFIDNHVGVFDDYYKEVRHRETAHEDLGEYGNLSLNARFLAAAIGERYPDSQAGQLLKEDGRTCLGSRRRLAGCCKKKL